MKVAMFTIPLLVASACTSGSEVDPALLGAMSDPEIRSPINYLLEVDESVDVSAAEQQMVAENAIVDCMAEKGFRYFPQSAEPTEIEAQGGPRSREEALTVGFGIHDSVERRILDGNDSSAEEESTGDPNFAYQNGLTPDELAEYETALWGIGPDEVDVTSGVPVDPVSGRELSPSELVELAENGCDPKAYREAAPAPAMVDFFLSRQYAELLQRIENDPELIELRDGWRSCMATTGHSFFDRQAMLGALYTTADTLIHDALEDHHDLSDSELERRVAALQDLELSVAAADWSCSSELREREPEIVRKHEVQFIEQNQALILSTLEELR